MQVATFILGAVTVLGLALPVAGLAANASAGLWVGDVVVERINRPGPASAAWDTTTNLPAATSFDFRVIIHVDTNGQARLLQRVLLTCTQSGAKVTNAITGQVTTNGAYRLLTDEAVVAAVRQVEPQAQVTRISSVNFPLFPPQVLNGQFGSSNVLNGTLTIPYDDPVNPFVHAYAPLHDNYQVRNTVRSKLPEGVESYTITRNLLFQFASQDPRDPTNPRWGIDQHGGDFHEAIEGLYRPVQVQGRFRLERLTTVGRLD